MRYGDSFTKTQSLELWFVTTPKRASHRRLLLLRHCLFVDSPDLKQRNCLRLPSQAIILLMQTLAKDPLIALLITEKFVG